MQMKLLKTHKVETPKKARPDDACFDLYVPEDSFLTLMPHASASIPLGIQTEIPEGYSAEVYIRSGVSRKKIMLTNGVGIIDSGYRGEWQLSIINNGNHAFNIKAGDRLAQFKLVKNIDVDIVIADGNNDLTETQRGQGGFGSTG